MDQVLNVFLEIYYDKLGIKIMLSSSGVGSKDCSGVQNVFKIWSIYHSAVIFTVFVISNVYIFLDTKKNNPELWGNVKTNRKIQRDGIEKGSNNQRKSLYVYGMDMEDKDKEIVDTQCYVEDL